MVQIPKLEVELLLFYQLKFICAYHFYMKYY